MRNFSAQLVLLALAALVLDHVRSSESAVALYTGGALLALATRVGASESAVALYTGGCAPTQSLDAPVKQDVLGCPYLPFGGEVCCPVNNTPRGSAMLLSCMAQENALDCASDCLPGASAWSLQHQEGASGEVAKLSNPRDGVRMCYQNCLSYYYHCYNFLASNEEGKDREFCDAIAAPEGTLAPECLGMPPDHCPNECQFHGTCDMTIAFAGEGAMPVGCKCDPGFLGYDCSWEYVRSQMPWDAEDGSALAQVTGAGATVGQCSILNSTCICYDFTFGPRCQISTIR